MAGKSKPKILVVDDERVIADTLAIILNQHGFEASAVYTGTAAVEREVLDEGVVAVALAAAAVREDLDPDHARHERHRGGHPYPQVFACLQDTAVLGAGRYRRSAGKRARPGA